MIISNNSSFGVQIYKLITILLFIIMVIQLQFTIFSIYHFFRKYCIDYMIINYNKYNFNYFKNV